MHTSKEVREIEAIIDKDFEELDFWKLNVDTATIISCQLFEEWIFQLDDIVNSSKQIEEKLKLQNTMLDLMQGLEWLIKMSKMKCEAEGFTFESDIPILEYAQEAYAKSLIHSKAEQIFIPYGQKLYEAKVNKFITNEIEIEFNFPSNEYAILEGINSVLLDEHNNYKLNKYNKVDKTISKLYGNIPEMVYHSRSFARVEFDFDFPDDYKVGPYTIKDIKNVWRRVIREAWWADRENKKKKPTNPEELPHLVDLKINSWNFDDINKNTAYQLIDDLSYTGKKKGEQRFTTPLTEPIFELSDGRKMISPKVILYNQPGRNILSTLNRIYGDEANSDSARKEIIFIGELSAITKDYENLIVCHDIPVEGTNIDYGIFDTKTQTLVLFEMKWFVEPITSIEIKSKDKEISKGLHIQLPKYKKAVEEEGTNFVLKAFKKNLDYKKSYYFVLTKVTIGSGFIKPSQFKTLNIRMIKKALFDTKGDLEEAARRLHDGFYYPKVKKDFSLGQDKGEMGGVTVIADSIVQMNNSFNLSIPSDDQVELFGIEMEPKNVPANKFYRTGPSQYQLFPRPRPTTINRKERRKQEQQRKKRNKQNKNNKLN